MFALLAAVIIISISYMNHAIKAIPANSGINIDYLTSNAKLEIGNILNVVYIGSNFIFQVLYSVLLFTPPSILIIPWLLHALNRRIHIKNYQSVSTATGQLEYTLFQPAFNNLVSNTVGEFIINPIVIYFN